MRFKFKLLQFYVNTNMLYSILIPSYLAGELANVQEAFTTMILAWGLFAGIMLILKIGQFDNQLDATHHGIMAGAYGVLEAIHNSRMGGSLFCVQRF